MFMPVLFVRSSRGPPWESLRTLTLPASNSVQTFVKNRLADPIESTFYHKKQMWLQKRLAACISHKSTYINIYIYIYIINLKHFYITYVYLSPV